MFVSFFPRPRLFFWSALLWTTFTVVLWYAAARNFGGHFGFGPPQPGAPPQIGVGIFWSPFFIWFDIYCAVAAGLFAAAWRIFSPHRWWVWSVVGSALILFMTYLQVEVSVVAITWTGPFYNLVQAGLSHTAHVTVDAYYNQLATFGGIILFSAIVGMLSPFFVSHYVFRWRTAMNDHYMANWPKLRLVEGAAQRVQEDTMRFSTQTEKLGVNFITSVLTLIAFLPLLVLLSTNIHTLPLIGPVPQPLVLAALFWSIFGTGLLALIGGRLPGLQYRNQRVEAAYRKELVYGEDDPDRARPQTVRELFDAVRHNYFRLFFNYGYFNGTAAAYQQFSVVFPYILLGPSVITGAITLGIFSQITTTFAQVQGSFQYLVTSWTDIVELMSIYRRLREFEFAIHDNPQGLDHSDLVEVPAR